MASDAGRSHRGREGGWLLPAEPVRSLDDHLAVGGGEGLAAALAMEPDEVIEVVRDAGLRGRGGAGFPTGVKWASVREAGHAQGSPVYLAVNGAEGEPGTYKDRALMAGNPFGMLEGAIIARYALGAERVEIGVKAHTGLATPLRAAIEQLVAAGWEQREVLHVVEGPDDYLFGEETGLLEVIEGGLPLPRWLPPFQDGLHTTIEHSNPTAVNNIETLANVPVILTRGAEAYRRVGTEESPGTMLFTVVGDVASPGVYELPLGTTLRTLLVDIAGASDIHAVFSGVSAPVITTDELDTPLAYETMRTAGTGLGSGGFVVYDSRHCIVAVAAELSRFLAVESCGQCTACKLGTITITDLLREVDAGRGTVEDLDAVADRLPGITNQSRCALPAGGQLLLGSMLQEYADEFLAHVGRACPSSLDEVVPKIESLDEDTGTVTYDTAHRERDERRDAV